MTTPLCNIKDKAAVAARRASAGTRGLGQISAQESLQNYFWHSAKPAAVKGTVGVPDWQKRAYMISIGLIKPGK